MVAIAVEVSQVFDRKLCSSDTRCDKIVAVKFIIHAIVRIVIVVVVRGTG